MDLPLVMSKPHFLHGDDMLSAHFEGLKPDPIKHQTTLYAEPMTGTVLKEPFSEFLRENIRVPHVGSILQDSIG